MKRKLAYLISLLKKHGFIGLIIKFIEKKTDATDRYYRVHYQDFLPTEQELMQQRASWKHMPFGPKISIVVPTYRTKERFLRPLIDCVLQQTYGNLELCIADGSCDGGESVGKIVAEYAAHDDRIRYQALDANGGISKNTNAGFAMATGEYIALLDHDDLLTPNALYEMVAKMNEKGEAPLFIYSDEDKIDAEGSIHFEPHFKGDFNEELLNHYNYICHFLVLQRSLLERVKGLDATYDGAQDYDFVLRCSENLKNHQIAHVPKILYHWRVHSSSTAGFSGNKDYAYEAAIRAVNEHLNRIIRCDLKEHQRDEKTKPQTATAHAIKGREYVAIERSCNTQNEDNLEQEWVICIGKGIKPIDSDWASKLIYSTIGVSAQVGMIGGKILYRKGLSRRVQSVGLAYDPEGQVHENFHGLSSYKRGYLRKAVVGQMVSACDLDFCVIRKEIFEHLSGFDETLSYPYRDLDFAFRVREAGYAVVVNPSVCAVSKMEKKGNAEHADFAVRWGTYIKEGDPFYNENIRSDGNL